MKKIKIEGNCDLCDRFKYRTFHHLIPTTCHRNKWFKKNFKKEEMKTRGAMLCKDCHDFIHDTWEEKLLGKKLNTLKLIKQNSKTRKFVRFVRKKK